MNNFIPSTPTGSSGVTKSVRKRLSDGSTRTYVYSSTCKKNIELSFASESEKLQFEQKCETVKQHIGYKSLKQLIVQLVLDYMVDAGSINRPNAVNSDILQQQQQQNMQQHHLLHMQSHHLHEIQIQLQQQGLHEHQHHQPHQHQQFSWQHQDQHQRFYVGATTVDATFESGRASTPSASTSAPTWDTSPAESAHTRKPPSSNCDPGCSTYLSTARNRFPSNSTWKSSRTNQHQTWVTTWKFHWTK